MGTGSHDAGGIGVRRPAREESHLAVARQFSSNAHMSTPFVALILAVGFAFWIFMILGIVFAVATFFFALAKGTNKNASPYVLIFGAFFLPIIVFAIFAKIALQFEDDNSPKNGANARVND